MAPGFPLPTPSLLPYPQVVFPQKKTTLDVGPSGFGKKDLHVKVNALKSHQTFCVLIMNYYYYNYIE